jgi:putative transposase
MAGNNCWGTPMWVPTSRFSVSSVGAPLCGCPCTPLCGCPVDDTFQKGTHAGVPLPASDAAPQPASQPEPRRVSPNQKFNATIGDVMDWFKTMTTNEYIRGVKNLGWEPFNGRLWQRNYYEHIIRNDFAYDGIAAYIIQNPDRWLDDIYFPTENSRGEPGAWA